MIYFAQKSLEYSDGLDQIGFVASGINYDATLRNLELIGAGRSIEEVLKDFPYLDREDVLEALQYAAWLSQEREIVLATG